MRITSQSTFGSGSNNSRRFFGNTSTQATAELRGCGWNIDKILTSLRGRHVVGIRLLFEWSEVRPPLPFPPTSWPSPPPLQEMWGTTSRKGPGSGFWIV